MDLDDPAARSAVGQAATALNALASGCEYRCGVFCDGRAGVQARRGEATRRAGLQPVADGGEELAQCIVWACPASGLSSRLTRDDCARPPATGIRL